MARPRLPLISRRKVAQAALQVIDDDGLGALSIRRLGEDLGVNGASLYYHYADKAAILQDVAAFLMSGIQMPDEEATSWLDWLVSSNVAYRRILLDHPNAVPLMLDHPPHAARRTATDFVVQGIMQRGLSRSDATGVVDAVEAFTLGSVLLATRASDRSRVGPVYVDAEYETLVHEIIRRSIDAARASSPASGSNP